MDQDIEHTYEALGSTTHEEDFEEFLDMTSAALRHVIRGESDSARGYLDSLSTWELGQVVANADRLRTLARELVAKRGKP